MLGPDPTVFVDIENTSEITFALEQAGIPIVNAVRIHNRGAEPLPKSTLTIELLPDLGSPVHIPVEALGAGERADLGVIDIALPPDRLRTVTEAERGQLVYRLTGEGEVLAEGKKIVDILAYNEWPRRTPPELLAMYVTPNHPVVTSILRRVRDRLGAQTGDNAIDGYQRRSPERVMAMVKALYESLQSFGISYQECLASFEEYGQKVRFADKVLEDQLANCLDMTLLAASCFEQMGLHPLVALVEGHAFPGVWLQDDRFPEGVITDAARLRTISALGEILFFDSSTTVFQARPPFEDACHVAREHLEDDAAFRFALDVSVARRGGFRPLPLRDVARFRPAEEVSPTVGRAASHEARALLTEAIQLPLVDIPKPPSSEPLDPVSARLARWRERLLDLSLRNRLLNFRDTKASLPLEIPDAERFEDALSEERSFEVVARPTVERDPRDPKLLEARTDEEERRARIHRDFGRSMVYSSLASADFMARVVHLDRTSRSDIEEGGANTLFAAIGFLRWFESESSQMERQAPLLLVPVALERQRLSSRVRLRGLPDDSVPNVTLVEKLRQDFGIDLSRLQELEGDEHGRDVSAIFQAVRQAIRHMPRWEVIEDVRLGLFTFSKFLMWRDLEENAAQLLESPVVRHIASASTSAFSNRAEAASPERLDVEIPASSLPLVVDADSTQMAAVVSGLRGRSFVLQGPPGTGKSQTITNLIAACLAEDKTVLFISEKMAALDVVKRRLEQVGLGDFCLELHSHKAQKKEVLDSFGRALARTVSRTRSRWEERSYELQRSRDELNAYTQALHAPRPLGKSMYEASARLLSLDHVPKIKVAFANVMGATESDFRALLDTANAYAVSARAVEPIASHPFRDVALVAWSAKAEASLQSEIEQVLGAISAVNFAGQQLAAKLGAPGSRSLSMLEELAQVALAASSGPVPPWLLDEGYGPQLTERAHGFVNASHALAASRGEIDGRWQGGFYQLDLEALEARFLRYARSFFLIAFFMLFGARKQLRAVAKGEVPSNEAILRDLGSVRSMGQRSLALEEERRALVQAFSGCWAVDPHQDPAPLLVRAEHLRAAFRRFRAFSGAPIGELVSLTDPSALPARRQDVGEQATALGHAIANLRRRLSEAVRLLSPQPGVVPEEASPTYLDDLSALFTRFRSGLSSFRSFSFYRASEGQLASFGAFPIIAHHQSGALRNEDIVPATERAFLHAFTDAVRDAEPALRTFDGPNRHRLVQRFREDDGRHIELARRRVAELLETRLPQGSSGASEASEMGKLQRELRKKARHWPVRRLLSEVPSLATRLKPCFLMSPMSVAQYLPADARKFDIVVFDEASQIGTHDAIGAIARGHQVVIVGDSKQLPPTAFFQRGVSEDEPIDENDVEELESILDEAVASGIPEQMLGWHYRSRHEALIDFSNQHYYDGRLNVFPAARGREGELGVSFHPVPEGVYDKSRTRTNRKEAEALVQHLVSVLRVTQAGARSFGIVTFSQAQQTLIHDLLEEARTTYPEIDAHFSSSLVEPVFIKNLENVQGDERDEILFSVGYGKDESGRIFMHFGPLNRQGGERRLNVAITRAREKLRVFSTLTHDQIDLSRTKATGARHLKAFLRYVTEQSRSSSLSRAPSGGGDFDSDYERQVYDALVAKGYRVDCQVGCGAYRIDLAVVHPDHPSVYLLGIECDGASYHSAATARDRDRLRQQVLEGLGWRLHRIWSTDWWFQREREIERVDEAIREALLRHEEEAARPALPARVIEEATEVSPQALLDPSPEPAPESASVSRGDDDPASPLTAYERARLPLSALGADGLYEPEYAHELKSRLLEVLRVEAPIHLDELSRRLGDSFGQPRLSDRLRRRIAKMTLALSKEATLRGDFVWRADQHPETFGAVRALGAEARSLDVVPEEELAAASAWVLSRSIATTEADLLRETAKVFGLSRAGARAAERVKVGLALLEARGLCAIEEDRIFWRG